MTKNLWDLLEEEIAAKAEDAKEEAEEAEGEAEDAEEKAEEVKAEVKEALVASVSDFLNDLTEMGLPINESEELADGLFEHLETIVEIAKLSGMLEGEHTGRNAAIAVGGAAAGLGVAGVAAKFGLNRAAANKYRGKIGSVIAPSAVKAARKEYAAASAEVAAIREKLAKATNAKTKATLEKQLNAAGRRVSKAAASIGSALKKKK